MRAAAIDRFGGPRPPSLHEVPLPSGGPREGLIALDTAGAGRGEGVHVWGRGGGAGLWGTAWGRDGLALVRRLGAAAAVDGRGEDLAAAARRFAPEGVDAVLAFAGGKPLTGSLDAPRRGGRVAYPNGVEPP